MRELIQAFLENPEIPEVVAGYLKTKMEMGQAAGVGDKVKAKQQKAGANV